MWGCIVFFFILFSCTDFFWVQMRSVIESLVGAYDKLKDNILYLSICYYYASFLDDYGVKKIAQEMDFSVETIYKLPKTLSNELMKYLKLAEAAKDTDKSSMLYCSALCARVDLSLFPLCTLLEQESEQFLSTDGPALETTSYGSKLIPFKDSEPKKLYILLQEALGVLRLVEAALPKSFKPVFKDLSVSLQTVFATAEERYFLKQVLREEKILANKRHRGGDQNTFGYIKRSVQNIMSSYQKAFDAIPANDSFMARYSDWKIPNYSKQDERRLGVIYSLLYKIHVLGIENIFLGHYSFLDTNTAVQAVLLPLSLYCAFSGNEKVATTELLQYVDIAKLKDHGSPADPFTSPRFPLDFYIAHIYLYSKPLFAAYKAEVQTKCLSLIENIASTVLLSAESAAANTDGKSLPRAFPVVSFARAVLVGKVVLQRLSQGEDAKNEEQLFEASLSALLLDLVEFPNQFVVHVPLVLDSLSIVSTVAQLLKIDLPIELFTPFRFRFLSKKVFSSSLLQNAFASDKSNVLSLQQKLSFCTSNAHKVPTALDYEIDTSAQFTFRVSEGTGSSALDSHLSIVHPSKFDEQETEEPSGIYGTLYTPWLQGRYWSPFGQAFSGIEQINYKSIWAMYPTVVAYLAKDKKLPEMMLNLSDGTTSLGTSEPPMTTFLHFSHDTANTSGNCTTSSTDVVAKPISPDYLITLQYLIQSAVRDVPFTKACELFKYVHTWWTRYSNYTSGLAHTEHSSAHMQIQKIVIVLKLWLFTRAYANLPSAYSFVQTRFHAGRYAPLPEGTFGKEALLELSSIDHINYDLATKCILSGLPIFNEEVASQTTIRSAFTTLVHSNPDKFDGDSFDQILSNLSRLVAIPLMISFDLNAQAASDMYFLKNTLKITVQSTLEMLLKDISGPNVPAFRLLGHSLSKALLSLQLYLCNSFDAWAVETTWNTLLFQPESLKEIVNKEDPSPKAQPNSVLWGKLTESLMNQLKKNPTVGKYWYYLALLQIHKGSFPQIVQMIGPNGTYYGPPATLDVLAHWNESSLGSQVQHMAKANAAVSLLAPTPISEVKSVLPFVEKAYRNNPRDELAASLLFDLTFPSLHDLPQSLFHSATDAELDAAEEKIRKAIAAVEVFVKASPESLILGYRQALSFYGLCQIQLQRLHRLTNENSLRDAVVLSSSFTYAYPQDLFAYSQATSKVESQKIAALKESIFSTVNLAMDTLRRMQLFIGDVIEHGIAPPSYISLYSTVLLLSADCQVILGRAEAAKGLVKLALEALCVEPYVQYLESWGLRASPGKVPFTESAAVLEGLLPPVLTLESQFLRETKFLPEHVHTEVLKRIVPILLMNSENRAVAVILRILLSRNPYDLALWLQCLETWKFLARFACINGDRAAAMLYNASALRIWIVLVCLLTESDSKEALKRAKHLVKQSDLSLFFSDVPTMPYMRTHFFDILALYYDLSPSTFGPLPTSLSVAMQIVSSATSDVIVDACENSIRELSSQVAASLECQSDASLGAFVKEFSSGINDVYLRIAKHTMLSENKEKSQPSGENAAASTSLLGSDQTPMSLNINSMLEWLRGHFPSIQDDKNIALQSLLSSTKSADAADPIAHPTNTADSGLLFPATLRRCMDSASLEPLSLAFCVVAPKAAVFAMAQEIDLMIHRANAYIASGGKLSSTRLDGNKLPDAPSTSNFLVAEHVPTPPDLCHALCELGRVLHAAYLSVDTSVSDLGMPMLTARGTAASAQRNAILLPFARYALRLRNLSNAVFRVAAAICPASPRAWNGVGVTEASFERAEYALQRSAQNDPRGVAWTNLALLYLSNFQIAKAWSFLERAKIVDVNSPVIAQALALIKEADEFQVVFDQANAASTGASSSSATHEAPVSTPVLSSSQTMRLRDIWEDRVNILTQYAQAISLSDAPSSIYAHLLRDLHLTELDSWLDKLTASHLKNAAIRLSKDGLTNYRAQQLVDKRLTSPMALYVRTLSEIPSFMTRLRSHIASFARYFRSEIDSASSVGNPSAFEDILYKLLGETASLPILREWIKLAVQHMHGQGRTQSMRGTFASVLRIFPSLSALSAQATSIRQQLETLRTLFSRVHVFGVHSEVVAPILESIDFLIRYFEIMCTVFEALRLEFAALDTKDSQLTELLRARCDQMCSRYKLVFNGDVFADFSSINSSQQDSGEALSMLVQEILTKHSSNSKRIGNTEYVSKACTPNAEPGSYVREVLVEEKPDQFPWMNKVAPDGNTNVFGYAEKMQIVEEEPKVPRADRRRQERAAKEEDTPVSRTEDTMAPAPMTAAQAILHAFVNYMAPSAQLMLLATIISALAYQIGRDVNARDCDHVLSVVCGQHTSLIRHLVEHFGLASFASTNQQSIQTTIQVLQALGNSIIQKQSNAYETNEELFTLGDSYSAQYIAQLPRIIQFILGIDNIHFVSVRTLFEDICMVSTSILAHSSSAMDYVSSSNNNSIVLHSGLFIA